MGFLARAQLARLKSQSPAFSHMLTALRFVQITAEFVQRFAELNGVMGVCTEPALFDLALAQARKGSSIKHSAERSLPE